MKIWHLVWLGSDYDGDYDCVLGFVIVAETEAIARQYAHDQAGDEGKYDADRERFDSPWLHASESSCIELKPEGEARIIIRDFNAG